MKLYKVTCRGMQDTHGIAFVAAPDPDAAYRTVLRDLEARRIGMGRDRELLSVELIAEDAAYPACDRRFYVAAEPGDQ